MSLLSLHSLYAHLTRCLLIFLLSLSCLQGFGQDDTLNALTPTDSTKNRLMNQIRQVVGRAVEKNVDQIQENKLEAKQEQLFEKLKSTAFAASNYLKRGVDTLKINKELGEINSMYAAAVDGVLINRGTAQTHRNLTTSAKIIRELLSRANHRKTQVDKYKKDLVNFRNVIDSLSVEKELYTFPEDSVDFRDYAQQLLGLALEMKPTDSTLEQAISHIDRSQATANRLVNTLNLGLDEIDSYEKDLYSRNFERELPDIWNPPTDERPFREIIAASRSKAELSLWFYTQNNLGKIFLVLFMILVAAFFLNTLKQIVAREKLLRADLAGQLVLRYPFLAAITVVLSLFQFIFPAPPFAFNCLFWIISSACLTVIFWGFIRQYWMRMWLVLWLLFVMACADNLVLQASRTERWLMLLLALAGAVTALIVLLSGPKKELKERTIVYFLGLIVILELFSIIFNLYGRYNFSKTLLISGYINVIIGISFLWTVRLINEALSLAFQVYQRPERNLLYINFERVGRRAPLFFYAFVIIGWFVLFGRNFYAFRFVTEPVEKFLFEERTIGNYSFKISNLFVFFIVLSLSMIISRLVSFFASDRHGGIGGSNKDGVGLGSWLLLIRIGIISIGLFLAVAAAGIPVDRITIILGALSVGVGLGLQSLVNNLVSGLIIAFEKPVNVGDIVELGGQVGTMKSIGFRSSIITTADGANIVVPNGDILSAHLVNWTMGKTMRRVELPVGVAYGSDLEKVQKLLNDVMQADDRILKHPLPVVLFQQFNASSIDVKMFFWVSHFPELAAIRSDLIAAITKTFAENGIVIPFPQTDLHVRVDK